MSDFFYKERLGPVFSPVINVKHEKIPPAVVSAIDGLLSPTGNMFTRAETVKKLMSVEKLDLDGTAKALSLKRTDVAGKLRLLEFSQKERSAILECGFCEADALEFLRLDKISRLYAIEFCRKNLYCGEEIKKYVDSVIDSKNTKKSERHEISENVRKFAINDMGFFFNSIENVLRLARKAGFEIKNEKKENKDSYDIHINIRKRSNKQGFVDKNTDGEYNV